MRIEGTIDEKQVRLDNYINAPGLTEASKKYGMSHETAITGRCAFLFTKLFVQNKIEQRGVFPPEILDLEAREYFFQEAAKLDITVDEITATRLA